ncbi:MAG: membrane dipeptidase [Saprospiraceae bacterium]|nr:membrane dipeptidase [Saprospiraceae bacterium]MBK8449298.1 membrane dipeptidase [Saprospiraceae bacterium]MBK8484630.1 membrane dipeptidase [Saprospiraceae bacterium]MBK9222058.1 membrane dipeptidase [Saprospiraceae bacterium]MBK9721032.1 membrane dipeptidase [Saprospiraceae bacterium]
MAIFIDAHCHPPLKSYLFGYSIFRESFGRKENNYFNIQVTQPALKQSGVNGVLAAHYLPEKCIPEDWCLVDVHAPVLKIFMRKYFEKVEGQDAFAQTLEMIENFETLFVGQQEAVIAHSFKEVEDAILNHQTFYIHCLEGGHHLGRQCTIEDYVVRIDLLKSKGVGLITLSHFYPNDIASPTEGMPPGSKKILGMQFKPPTSVTLTTIGEGIITKLLDSGIIIDLTHTNPTARNAIFELNKQRSSGMRPLVFSHVGVRALFHDACHPEFALMSPDDEEILKIKECNGMIGIIFMNYWLTGKEEKPLLWHKDFGFDNILRSIKHIVAITGSFDHVGIGTDFDGWADPPDDYYDASMLGEFKHRLVLERNKLGATEEDIEKITGGNLLRVLKEGWVS